MLSSDFKPYLLRAFYEYLLDRGLTPYIHVFVNEFTQVPQEFVVHNAITLNIGLSACSDLQIGNDSVNFKARFSGQVREVNLPMGHILSIYARENTDLILTFALEKRADNLILKESESVQKPVQKVQKKLSGHLKVVKKKI